MISAAELGGLMAMMPAFATDDAASIDVTQTIAIDRLHAGVDRMIRDGADVLATTGSFGECHALLHEEFRLLANETVAAVAGRIPLFLGVTSVNARDVIEKCNVVKETKADGILVGVPYYFPSSVPNAVGFLRDISERYPNLAVMLYHNPDLHHVKLPTEAVLELARLPNVVAMKDSHRDPIDFMRLQELFPAKLSVFVNQRQYFQYESIGAAGLWSIDAWMGPTPVLALRDAVRRGDAAAARDITLALAGPPRASHGLAWRETAMKVGIRMAGYVDPGPLRPPFVKVPDDVLAAQRDRVALWQSLCEKYGPIVA